MGGTYFIKIKPRCSPETIYVTRIKSPPTGRSENIAEFEMFFLFSWLICCYFSLLQALALSKGQLCCYFVQFLYCVILFEASDYVISGCYCGSNDNHYNHNTVIAETLKNTVFPALMPCNLVHTAVSDSLVGKMLVASSSKISVLL